MLDSGSLVGVVAWSDLLDAVAAGGESLPVHELMRGQVVVAYPDETLRNVADRMAEYELGVLPVVERQDPDHLLGVITQFELLRARQRQLEEDRHRERVLRVRSLPPGRRGPSHPASPGEPDVEPLEQEPERGVTSEEPPPAVPVPPPTVDGAPVPDPTDDGHGS